MSIIRKYVAKSKKSRVLNGVKIWTNNKKKEMEAFL
jgi:hypothetical protein